MLKVTAGCRFIAAKRLANHDKKLTRVTALASSYVIGLTILPYFMKLSMQIADLYNLVTVGLSIVILVSSLLQYSNGDVVNAEQHHRSALEINELRRLLMLKAETAKEKELEDFTDRYNPVLQKYSINHDDIDFQQYKLERPEMYPWLDWKQRFAIRLLLAWDKHLATIVLFFMTVCFLGLILYGISQVAPH